jgi:hypothetical protein
MYFLSALIAALLLLTIGAAAQSNRRKPAVEQKTPVVTPMPVAEPTASGTPEQTQKGKRNERPVTAGSGDGTSTVRQTVESDTFRPVYVYDFTHPYYLIRKLTIEHDESGKGRISFMKGSYTEPITDPLEISPAAMERLRSAFTALDFLNSTESYQYEKDMPHLGVTKITMRKEGRERTTEFNWTSNKDAKAINDEYRKLGNQFIWMFDINLARENQPLQTPGLMDELDSLVRRNDVSDGQQLVPLLKKLSVDEHLPLIARNHAAKIIAQIEKVKK